MKATKIDEIFYSIQGEASRTGSPCVFIRFAGCDLNCSYCDTAYAKTSGTSMSIKNILSDIRSFSCKYVCITGGEPLLQKEVHKLIDALLSKGYRISLETNGCKNISGIDKKVHITMDIKCPGSKEIKNNLYKNIKFLKPTDDIKFVISNKTDYTWAKTFVVKKKLTRNLNIFFSPVHNKLNARKLAGWILRDNLEVRLQVQLHKLIGLK